MENMKLCVKLPTRNKKSTKLIIIRMLCSIRKLIVIIHEKKKWHQNTISLCKFVCIIEINKYKLIHFWKLYISRYDIFILTIIVNRRLHDIWALILNALYKFTQYQLSCRQYQYPNFLTKQNRLLAYNYN